ncbi:MAG TPA: peptide-methionine (S)-S-oxide reductase MsrA [Candidatus Accumulibacter phosphatis]|nr:MAG: Peptide methionine sulfoxide reductase MsrA [Candidatus Accumulibacter sp. SK-11]HAY28776.1 peptide-methionine (S)-S-oxide reductase [Accumulibacter sp.]HRL74889.1 peptide-methionine (S)-S-oxide reductase MsrA [Candidatus Accumulibacter phosphatis]HCN69281.1 peptide-methionine (S)-S-oxide reductase [Accumulibacter sp.]HCV13684.1 peptide-methionine (S)-S-oxide reductase [Accumulibacter sp.]
MSRMLLIATLLLVAGPVGGADATGGQPADVRTAIFAGGCFWCIEADFEKLPGVIAVESGYTAGRTPKPTYEQVSSGNTGHTEAVRVSYDARQLSYGQLLDYFWRHIDPTVRNRQFCDVGSQYRSGIYWQNEVERKAAEGSRDALLASGKLPRIETEIAAASVFYLAEEYHQDYYRKNSVRYSYYRLSCGRDARVRQIWGND